MSSLRALSPPPPVGQCVLQRYVWYGCCRLLAVMSSLRARYHTKLLFSPCKRCPCPCSDAVHSPSSPPSGLRGFVPVVRDRWEEQTGGTGGWGPGRGAGDTMGGGGFVGARDPRAYILLLLHLRFWGLNCIVLVQFSFIKHNVYRINMGAFSWVPFVFFLRFLHPLP